MQQYDRIDLEQHIMKCSNVTDDLDLVLKITESEDMDRIQNSIIGLKEIYQQKFEDLWACFETLIAEKKII